MSENNYFTALANINVNDKTEKKNNLTYLSWAWAWGEIKKQHPDATYTIYENKDGWNYHTDGRTCWVKTGMTVQGIEHIEYLPVMDHRNASISADKVTSFDVNKAIQRSLTKAAARHGLGLYIYAGEDLPDDGEEKPVPASKLSETQKTTPAKVEVQEHPMTPKERVESLCRLLRITVAQFGELYAKLQAEGKIPNKKTAELMPSEWQALIPLMQKAAKG
jgi:hypothetical protein